MVWKPVLLASAFLSLALAGCVSEAPTPQPEPKPDAQAQLLALLEGIAAPEFNVAKEVDWWADFATTYIKRDYGLPNNDAAAKHIQSALEDAGFSVRVLEFATTLATNPVTVPSPTLVKVIEATRAGVNNPDRAIGLISHYDTHANTIQGAYDDASGVAIELSICRLLAKVETNKTISCLFFDAEERGLLGSRYYVDAVVNQNITPFRYDQAFGYDMVGLNWPGHTPWDLYVMAGLDHPTLAQHMLAHLDFLSVLVKDFFTHRFNVTADGRNASRGITILDVHDRNSDEQNFKKAGIPVVRFAGGRKAADYPEYHKRDDTVDFVYQYAGGRDKFEQGYAAVVLLSYYAVLAYDKYDPKGLPVIGA
jgi:hypothetical protein